MYYIYMVRCSDRSHYTGIARDIRRRLNEHCTRKKSAARYTLSHHVVCLDALWIAPDRSIAQKAEARIKSLSAAKKKDLLLHPELLRSLAPGLDGCRYLPGMTLQNCLFGVPLHVLF